MKYEVTISNPFMDDKHDNVTGKILICPTLQFVPAEIMTNIVKRMVIEEAKKTFPFSRVDLICRDTCEEYIMEGNTFKWKKARLEV